MKKDAVQDEKSEETISISDLIKLQDGLRKEVDFNKPDEEMTSEELAKKAIYVAMDEMVEKHLGKETKEDLDEKRRLMEKLGVLQDNISKLTDLGKEIERNFIWQKAYLINHFDKSSENHYKLVVDGVTNDLIHNKEWDDKKRLEMANTITNIIKAYKDKVISDLKTKRDLLSVLLPGFEKAFNETDFDFYNKTVAQEGSEEMKVKFEEWLSLSKKLSESRAKAIEALEENIFLDEIIPQHVIDHNGDADQNLSAVDMKTRGERMVKLLTEANTAEDEIEVKRQPISEWLFGKADGYMDFKNNESEEKKETTPVFVNPLQDKAWFRLAKVIYIGAYSLAILIGLVFMSEEFDSGFWFLVGSYIFFLLVKKAFYYVVIGKTSWETR